MGITTFGCGVCVCVGARGGGGEEKEGVKGSDEKKNQNKPWVCFRLGEEELYVCVF